MPKFSGKYRNYVEEYEKPYTYTWGVGTYFNIDPKFIFLKPIKNNEKRFGKVYSKLDKIFINGLPSDHNGIVDIKFKSCIIDKEYIKPNIYKKFLRVNFIVQTIVNLLKNNQSTEYVKWEINFNNKPTSSVGCYVFKKYKKLWKKSINPLDDDDMESAIKVYKNSSQEIEKLEISYKKLREQLKSFGIRIEIKLDMPKTSSHNVNKTYNNFLSKLENNINGLNRYSNTFSGSSSNYNNNNNNNNNTNNNNNNNNKKWIGPKCKF